MRPCPLCRAVVPWKSVLKHLEDIHHIDIEHIENIAAYFQRAADEMLDVRLLRFLHLRKKEEERHGAVNPNRQIVNPGNGGS